MPVCSLLIVEMPVTAPAGAPLARTTRAKLMSDAELLADLPGKAHLVIRLDREGRPFLHATADSPPGRPGGRIDTGCGVFTTAIDPGTKSIHLVTNAALTESALHLATRIGAAHIDAMRRGGHLVLPPDPAYPVIEGLKKHDFRTAAAAMAAAREMPGWKWRRCWPTGASPDCSAQARPPAS